MSQTLDPSAQAVLDAVREAALPPLETMSPEDARIAYKARRSRRQPDLPPILGTEDRVADTSSAALPVRIYRPEEAGQRPVIVFFHGGGWTIGDLESHDAVCRLLCASSGMGVVAVDYRLAPEHRFPAAVDDAIAAVDWVRSEAGTFGFDGDWIGVAGDSAGGNLSAVVALAMRDRADGVPIRAQGLIYPATDMTRSFPSQHEARTDIMLTHSLMRWFCDQYVDPVDHRDWRASPHFAADLSGLPPTYVMTAGFDPLCDEGRAYAAALQTAGVETVDRLWPGQFHGFVTSAAVIPEAIPAIAEIGDWFRELAARDRQA